MANQALNGAVRRVRARLAAEQHRDLSDRQLLQRFTDQHDDAAFTALVQRHQRRIYAALTRVLIDRADVEDAFQATFLVLVRKAKSVRWQAGLGTWLYTVAHQVAVRARGAAHSRQVHEGRAAGRLEPSAAPPDLSWREACAMVHEELDRLPERLRLPLLLCYIEGLSRDEAAAQLGLTATTVKGRLERGRDLLRDRLTRRGIVLTAGLLGALATSSVGAASAELLALTVAAAGCPSARVAALARGVTAMMILSKFKVAVGLLLAVGVVGLLLGARSPGAPTAAAPVARADAKPAAAAAGKEEERDVEVAGRVVAGDKPVAGANISLWTGADKPRALAVAGADGRFRAKVGRADLKPQTKLIAQAGGRGADWVELRVRPAGDVTLTLGEDMPIEGKVVDLEGRPVVGAAVQVREVSRAAKGDLDAYLDAMQKINEGIAIPPLLSLPPEALGVGPTKTDKQGRFRLTGFGRERKVDIAIQGRGIEQQWVAAITRPGFTNRVSYIRGPSFRLLVGPGKELTGVVKEKTTGRPAAGVQVYCGIGQARTDEQGRFRIEGLRKQKEYYVWVGGKDSFNELIRVKDTPGRDPVHMQAEIQRGIYVEGTLLDRQTSKPVSGVVSAYIKSDNPHLKRYTFSQGVGFSSASAGADGKFRLLTIPGPGYLAAKAYKNQYARAVVKEWDGVALPTAPHNLFPHYDHGIVAINPDEKKPASLKCDIALERGLSKSGSMVGPDGKPVSDVIVFGLTAVPDPGGRTFPRQPAFGEPPPVRQKGSTFTAVGLNPRAPRYLVFLQPERKLAKVLRLGGDEKGPLVVKLEPLGAVAGRVLGGDGGPAAERVVTPGPNNHFAYYKEYPIDLLHNNQHQIHRTGRLVLWLPDRVETDAAGKFKIDGLIPGLKYHIQVSDRPLGQGVTSSHFVDVSVEPGKAKDLGDLKPFRKF
jgi:RNA polymerase sigma factor (sigma-70 family)